MRRAPTFAITATVAMLAILVSSPGGIAKPAGCSSLPNQAAGQERFLLLDGSPSRNAGGMDSDGDGVACEGLPGPYAGYATIGYHRGRGFFYGAAAMPETDDGFACLVGNRSYPEGPRRLRVFRVRPGPDLVVSRLLGASASGGRLLWKLEKELAPGYYYAVFEERQREAPYRPPECPGFASRETRLPRVSPR